VSQKPSTAPASTIPTTPAATSRPMRTSGYVRLAALVSELCPKCQAGNHDRAVNVWRVADSLGVHYECDVCAYEW
jgi:hypothetical protein